ncbi:MAG: NAD-dependent succinate-semialdehyde dehydrogenase [Patescibacteria group bacterium]|jgi:succinate-semialdehyde dehydrogenase/glutarate-semialdehyde dehydrogenase
MKMTSINPFTEEINAEFENYSGREIETIVTESRKEFVRWKLTTQGQRVAIIKNIGRLLIKNKNHFSALITKEMGKPIKESAAEIEKCALVCDYYGDNAEKFLQPEIIPTEAKKSYASFEPLGVILAIMPWNFPFWQVFRFAIPALAVGNTVLLKHAPSVPISALAIEKLMREAGLPEHAFRALLIDEAAAMKLIEDNKVDGVSLTGSNRAGSQIGALAGKKIIKAVLELGGSDPFLVLEDADISRAAKFAVKSRFVNAGQSCIAAKRFIVMEKAAVGFLEKFRENLLKLNTGDPMDPATDIGPLAQERFVELLERQLNDSLALGGKAFWGPEIKSAKGFFFRPVIVAGADSRMRIMNEEVFGPIAPVIIVKTEVEAIQIANATEYGLGASVWSENIEKAERIAAKIDAGFISINDMVKSDPRLPFGGVKNSGVGRELSHYGLKEFVNVKTIVVNN